MLPEHESRRTFSLFLSFSRHRRKIGQLINCFFLVFSTIQDYISNNFKAYFGPVSLTQRDIIARMLPSPLFFLSHSLSFLIHALFSLVFFPRISPLPEFSNPTNFAAPSNPTIASRFFHVTVIADCCRFQVKHVFFFFFKFSTLRYTFLARIFLFQLHCIVIFASRQWKARKRQTDISRRKDFVFFVSNGRTKTRDKEFTSTFPVFSFSRHKLCVIPDGTIRYNFWKKKKKKIR